MTAPYEIMLRRQTFKDSDLGFAGFPMEKFSSEDRRAAQAKIFKDQFMNLREFFQIQSWALLEIEGEKVLIGNLLSDSAFAIEQKNPIPSTHANYFSVLMHGVPESYRINLNYFGLLLQLFGSSFHDYIIGLMYGDNMISYWKHEYDLGNIWQVQNPLIVVPKIPFIRES